MKVDIINDLSTLTTVNKLAIDRLFDKVLWCVSDSVANAASIDDRNIELDFGFGLIKILIDDNSIKYRFIPSLKLEKAVIDSVVNKHNLLNVLIENNLVQRLTTIYKDMF